MNGQQSTQYDAQYDEHRNYGNSVNAVHTQQHGHYPPQQHNDRNPQPPQQHQPQHQPSVVQQPPVQEVQHQSFRSFASAHSHLEPIPVPQPERRWQSSNEYRNKPASRWQPKGKYVPPPLRGAEREEKHEYFPPKRNLYDPEPVPSRFQPPPEIRQQVEVIAPPIQPRIPPQTQPRIPPQTQPRVPPQTQ